MADALAAEIRDSELSIGIQRQGNLPAPLPQILFVFLPRVEGYVVGKAIDGHPMGSYGVARPSTQER